MDPARIDDFEGDSFPKPRGLLDHYGNLVEELLELKATRRSMLLGATGMSAALPLIGPLARAASNFACVTKDNAITITIAGVIAWEIDCRWFDGAPRLEVRKSQSKMHVRLRHALFPGTNVPADLLLRAKRIGTEWIAHLTLDGLGFASEFPFHAWLLGFQRATSPINIEQLSLRSTTDLRMHAMRGMASFGPDWTLDLTGFDDASLHVGKQHAPMRALRIELSPKRSKVPAQEGTANRHTAMWPALEGAEPLHLLGTTPRVSLTANHAHLFIRASSNAARLLAQQHEGRAQLRWSGTTALRLLAQRADFALDYAGGLKKANGTAHLLGEVWIDAGDFAAEFRQPTADGKILLASNDPPSDRPTELFAMGVPHARRFIVSLPGCDAAMFKLRAANAESPDHPVAYGADITAFAHRRIPLDDYDLDVRRAADAFVATLRFKNVDLTFTIHGWRLVAGKSAAGALPFIEYDFGSQHLLEQAVYISDWPCANVDGQCKSSDARALPLPEEVAALAMLRAQADNTWNRLPNPPLSLATMQAKQFTANELTRLLDLLNGDKTLRDAFGKFRANPELRKLLGDGSVASGSSVKVERARPSRLLFQLDARSSIPLTLDALLSWASYTTSAPASQPQSAFFTPVLPKRAQEAGTKGLSDENPSKPPIITRPLSLSTPLGGSCEYATGIEVPARLVMSPIRGDPAHWTQSSTYGTFAGSGATRPRNELWSVRLVDTKLRAVFTPDARETPSVDCGPRAECTVCPSQDDVIQVDVFNPPYPYAGGNAHGEFRASTDARDRHELVALTALYGFSAKCGTSQVLDCMGENGHYVPVPIDVPLLQITSLGANFKYKGRWDPPSAPTGQRGALSVTRYQHHGQIGRDLFTRVEYKGFLFPLGHPAILIKVTERRFCIEKSANGAMQSVARLVQRFFIDVPAFTRSFPTINQPNENRCWGHTSITIKEFTTPELAAPDENGFAGLGQSAFWPVTLCGDDVIFPFGETDTRSSYCAPQVFVDNNVVHTSDMLTGVINEWRDRTAKNLNRNVDAWPSGNERGFAKVLSGRLPYVPGTHGDNTDVETDQVLLDVQTSLDDGYPSGRIMNGMPEMNSRMEKENQPPFYPVRRRSRVGLTQISTITGNTTSRYLMEYAPQYGKRGFAPDANRGQIFAIFVHAAPQLDFSANTSRSGGFASPSTSIIYLSAQRGLIGGRQSDLMPLASAASPSLHVRRNGNVATASAYNDDFDPTAFFSTFIGDAKLLGIVRIVDILKIALAASGTKIPTITRENVFDLAKDALQAILPDIIAQLGEADQTLNKESQVPRIVATRLEPGLKQMTDDAVALYATLNAKPVDEATMLEQLRTFGSEASALAAQANTISQHPEQLLPPDDLIVIDQLRSVFDALQNLRMSDFIANCLRPMAEALVKDAVASKIADVKKTIEESPELESLRQTLRTLEARLSEMAAKLQAGAAAAVDELWTAYQSLLDAIDQYHRDVLALIEPTADQAGVIATDVNHLLAIVQSTLSPIKTSIDTDEFKVAATKFVSDMQDLLTSCEQDLAPKTEQMNQDDVARAQRILAGGHQVVTSLANDLATDIARLAVLDSPRQPGPPKLDEKTGRMSTPAPGWDVDDAQVRAALMQIDYFTAAPSRVLVLAGRLVEVVVAVRGYQALSGYKKACADLFDGARTSFIALRKGFGFPVDLQLTTIADRFDSFADQVKKLGVDASLHATLSVVADSAVAAGIATRTLNDELIDGKADNSLFPFDSGAFCHDSEAFAKGFVSARTDETKALNTFANDCAEMAQIIAWWNGVAAKLPTGTADLLRHLDHALDADIRQSVQRAFVAQAKPFCDAAGKLAAALAPLLNHQTANDYISDALRDALNNVNATLSPNSCPSTEERWPARLLVALNQLGTLLTRALSVQGVGQLIKVDKILTDIVASLGVPTRVRVSYDWTTDVHPFPDGDGAVFEPLDDQTLSIRAMVEAGVQGGPPIATMNAVLSPFQINLFGKGAENFLTITFDRLKLTLPQGGKLTCDTNVTQVTPGPMLGFVQSLESLFGGDSGYLVLPTFNGIKVGYEYHKDAEELGGFFVQNIAFSIYADMPFDNSPVRFTMYLADKVKPFLISAGIYGGGGFFGIQATSKELEVLEASFEYGAVTGFTAGVLTGSCRITAGIYIRLGGRAPAIEGFFCAAGECNIAGVITIGASLRVTLASSGNAMTGTAVYEFHFTIGFATLSYSVTVTYLKQGDQSSGAKKSNALFSSTANEHTLEANTTQEASDDEMAFSDEAWKQLWTSTGHPKQFIAQPGCSCAPLSDLPKDCP